MANVKFQDAVSAHAALKGQDFTLVLVGDQLPRTKTPSGKIGDPRLPRKNEHLKKAGRFMIRTPLTKAFIACLATALFGVDVRDFKWTEMEALILELRKAPKISVPLSVLVSHSSPKVVGKKKIGTGLGLNDLDGPIPVLMDALMACGVIADDVLSTRLLVDKLPPSPKVPGLAIRVVTRRVTSDELDALTRVLQASTNAQLAKLAAQKPVRAANRLKRLAS